jgi:murein DD-endopeptidase MepM/ murein hydrolase activator NlpD
MRKNRRLAALTGLFIFILPVLLPIFTITARAYEIDEITETITIDFPLGFEQEMEKVLDIPGIRRVDNISVDNGIVEYEIITNKLIVKVKNGTVVDTAQDSKLVTDTRRAANTADLPASISYNKDGYTGTLYKKGSPYQVVLSGSPAASKTVTVDRTWTDSVYYRARKATDLSGNIIWIWDYDHTESTGDPGTTISYSEGEYSGILSSVQGTSKTCINVQSYSFPSQPTEGQVALGRVYTYKRVYSGTISKPDTRVYGYEQVYEGTVIGSNKPRYRYTVTATVVKAKVKTMTYTFERGASRTREATITIPKLSAVVSVKVDTGTVTYQQLDVDKIKINVSNGAPVGSYNPSKYVTVTDSYTSLSSSPSFSNSYYYNDGYYSGYISKSGSPWTTSYTETKFVSYYWGSIYKTDIYRWTGSSWVPDHTEPYTGPYHEYYSDSEGYSGWLSRVNTGISSITYYTMPSNPYIRQTAPYCGYYAYYNMEGTVSRTVYTHYQDYAGWVYGPTEYYYAYNVVIEYVDDAPAPPGLFINPTANNKEKGNSTLNVKWNPTTDWGPGTASTRRYELEFYDTNSWVSAATIQGSIPASEYEFILPYLNTNKARFRVRAVTNLGYSPWVYSDEFVIDSIPPTVTASKTSSDQQETTGSITLTFSDNLSGVKTKQYAWHFTNEYMPESWSDYTAAIEKTDIGTWYLWYRAVDNAGNEAIGWFGPYKVRIPADVTISAVPQSRDWDDTDVVVTVNVSVVGTNDTRPNKGGGGGGATDIRIGGNTLAHRVIVAGGGGGAGGDGQGGGGSIISGTGGVPGVGGGLSGTDGKQGTDNTIQAGYGGRGGTNTSGGAGGSTTTTSYYSNDRYYQPANGGGGGGGYYGGGGGGGGSVGGAGFSIQGEKGQDGTLGKGGDGGEGAPQTYGYYSGGGGGGGGGSSYIGGVTNGLTIPGNQQMPNPSGGTMIGNSGHGFARITVINSTQYPAGTTFDFSYTGEPQRIELPAGTYKLQVWGAQGGTTGGTPGGKGGYAEGTITLNSPQTVWVYVGGKGEGPIGGFNGGGNGFKTIARLEAVQYAWSKSRTSTSSWSSLDGNQVTQSEEGVWYLHVKAIVTVSGKTYEQVEVFGPYKIDKTAPAITFSPDSQAWTNNDISVTITASDTASGVKTLYYRVSNDNGLSWTNWNTVSGNSTNLTFSSTGVFKIQAYAIDNAGNTGDIVTSGTYLVDKLSPTVNFNPNGNETWSKQHTVTVTVSDSHSGVDTSSLQYAWATSTTTPSSGWQPFINGQSIITPAGVTGDYYLFIKAKDKAGNEIIVYSNRFRIDNTPPTAPIITLSTENWTNQNVTVTIVPGTDNHSGIDRIEYRINGGSWQVYSSSFIISSEGVTTVEARTIDKAGNSSSISSKQTFIDRTAPTVTANPVSRDWGNTNVTVTLTFSDSGGAGLLTKQYAWSTSTSTPSSWTNYSFPVTQSSEGIWYLHAKAVDMAGNIVTVCFGPYKIDKTLPIVSASPATGGWSNTPITVTLTYSDGGSGLRIRQYAWSTSTVTPSTWNNYTSPVTQSGEGIWYLHVKAADVAGNVYTGYFGPYKIDRTAPAVSASPPSREWGDTPVTVTLTFSDSGGSGIKDKLYSWSTNTNTPTEWNNYEAPVTQATPGVWYLHVKVTDTAGNVTTTYFGPYTIDELKYIEVIPSAVTIVRTETLQLTVKAVYHLKTEDITTSAQYSSSNDSIVTVSPNGAITGRAVGQAVITAVYKGKQAQCTVTVQEPEKTVAGTITITKTPTYVFTRWNKTADGQPSRMDITISWDNLNLLILRADKTVLRSEPITVTRAESQHRINRYTIPETYSWGTLTYSKLTNYSAGSGSYRAVYEYDKAGKPNSPFTFTGYYTCEGEEKSFSVTVYIPVNGIATTLLRPSVVPLSLGFQPALTNSENNTWKYSGVWPASGVLTLGGSAGDLAWPVPGSTVISSYFGRRVDPIDGVVRMHYGIDIPAPEGTNIVAPDNGKVVYTGYSEDFGNILVIRSGIYDFIFGHCSNILVSNGQTVSKGQAIAKVGSTGRATGPHLDFRVTLGPYTQGNYIDPLTVVNPTK